MSTTLPGFPDSMFPNTVIVKICNDVVNKEGGANPTPDAGVSMRASVQDKGSRAEDRMGVACAVVEYRVSFQVDPAGVLPRALRIGDEIVWGVRVLSVTEPARDKTGLGWAWRATCEYVTN